MNKTKPFLLITGFLGAGKTTLLRRMLHELRAKNINTDVILNDYLNANIDVATLDPSLLSSVAPLAAGCACCESLEELVQLCKTAGSGKGDLLLVELNGTADPLVLLETFTLLENRLAFFPRYQVCVIDARYWGKRDEFEILERRQLETAGFWYLSHKNEVPKTDLKRIKESIRRASNNSRETNIENLVHTLHIEIKRSKTVETRVMSSSHDMTRISSRKQGSLNVKQQYLKDSAHKLSHRFTGCQFPLPDKVDGKGIQRLMNSLPNWVIRAKALVRIVDKTGFRWLFEKVGNELIQNPIPTYELPSTPSSLMCIGPKLDPDKLRRLVETEFGIFISPLGDRT